MTSTPLPATSHASVATDSPERYAKQLASHLGRKLEVTEEPDGTRLRFSDGDCLLACTADHLEMSASAKDADALAVVEDIVGRHLERFGTRSELAVSWVRP
jgi:hypothetical protein